MRTYRIIAEPCERYRVEKLRGFLCFHFWHKVDGFCTYPSVDWAEARIAHLEFRHGWEPQVVKTVSFK